MADRSSAFTGARDASDRSNPVSTIFDERLRSLVAFIKGTEYGISLLISGEAKLLQVTSLASGDYFQRDMAKTLRSSDLLPNNINKCN